MRKLRLREVQKFTQGLSSGVAKLCQICLILKPMVLNSVVCWPSNRRKTSGSGPHRCTCLRFRFGVFKNGVVCRLVGVWVRLVVRRVILITYSTVLRKGVQSSRLIRQGWWVKGFSRKNGLAFAYAYKSSAVKRQVNRSTVFINPSLTVLSLGSTWIWIIILQRLFFLIKYLNRGLIEGSPMCFLIKAMG